MGFLQNREELLEIDLHCHTKYSGDNYLKPEELKAIHVARLRNLPSIGGSDCHSKEQVGRAFTEFKNSVHTIDELIEEIKKGNCKGMTP